MLPYWAGVPSVVTVHDVIHLLFPQYLPSRVAVHYARQMIGRAVSTARTVMTVSSASKRDLLGFFDIDPARVRVIPNGIDPAMTTEMDPAELARIKARFQLDGRSILFVGNIKPHKNVERLIEAFARLRQDESLKDVKLIVVGDELSKYPALRRAVARHQIRRHVRFFGFVPEMTLVALYRARRRLRPAVPLRGLRPAGARGDGERNPRRHLQPLLPPGSRGRRGPDGPIPYDVDAIASATRRVLQDEDLQARLIRDGKARAKEFGWEQSVRQIHEVYLDALEP